MEDHSFFMTLKHEGTVESTVAMTYCLIIKNKHSSRSLFLLKNVYELREKGKIKEYLYFSVCKSELHWSSVSELSVGNLLKMQNSGPHPTSRLNLWMWLRSMHLTSHLGDSSLLMFENTWPGMSRNQGN